MIYDNPVTTPAHHAPRFSSTAAHGPSRDAAAAHQAGVRNALETGYAVLSRGGSALDAVEAAVTVLEDNPAFDAGRGSFLTSDGRVQLDALLMDGGRMKAGGVACVERLRNPIQAARLVLEKSRHVYFVGPGAEQFAHAHGMALIDNAELVLDRERERLAQARPARPPDSPTCPSPAKPFMTTKARRPRFQPIPTDSTRMIPWRGRPRRPR